ncbi:MAG: hypothetical protein HND54_04080 [Bacteroidetes bacterium]|nr:hypothetical protein [Flavobacteriales bacterium]NOG56894.1 hypothetical protein [Bacteroidota bacterium]
MKTLALTFLLAINSIQFSFAQNDPNINQVVVSSVYEDGITIINWESNREVNTSYYLIEKSIDGQNFEIIGKTKAGSSTYKTKSYEFEDVDSLSQRASYRITLVLMDGSTIATLLNTSSEMNVANSINK